MRKTHHINPYKPSHRSALLAFLSALLAIVALSSCSNLRYLEEGQQLYTGSKINIESDEKIRNKPEIEAELQRVLRPQPNERFLWWRTRLWLYNIAGDEPRTYIGRQLKNRFGRPPVLFEDFDLERGERLMENRLFNLGFFDPTIEHKIREGRKKAGVTFTISLNPPFIIDQISTISADTEIGVAINTMAEESLIRSGQPYRLSVLREERERIARNLREQGYFFFHHDFLLFRADTLHASRSVNLELTIKANTPTHALVKQKIGNVYINADHSLTAHEIRHEADTVKLASGVFLLNNHGQFRENTLARAIFLKSGEYYSIKDHDLTLTHLMGLGVFKFVNIRFFENTSSGEPRLDVRILLTPMEKKSLSTELRGVSKSTNFAGPGLTVSFNNRNFLSGAEHFSLNLDGAWETLLGQRERQAASLEAGISSELSIPRFVAPFGISNVSTRFVPKTNISLSFNLLRRTDAFSVSSLRSQWQYVWNQSVTSQYRYSPFVFNIFSLGNVSPEYEQFFSQDVLLRRGLFEQFLLGSEFSSYWNTQLRGPARHAWYFNYNLDLSGNLTYLFADVLGLATPLPQGGYGIFKQSFSQFTKTDFDLRYYLNMGKGQRLATRLAAGIGVPYGNSETLPYVKLFTAGGSNGIRAFHPRSLGPGSYLSPDTLSTSLNVYQSGEIKLEFSAEYRFSMTPILKGALFADAGNVWNIRERENAPGGQFTADQFLSQIALGTGFGIRFDFTFFILRFDLAFPLAVPYDSSPGYFQPVKPLDRTWRRDNLLLNIAIGYPF